MAIQATPDTAAVDYPYFMRPGFPFSVRAGAIFICIMFCVCNLLLAYGMTAPATWRLGGAICDVSIQQSPDGSYHVSYTRVPNPRAVYAEVGLALAIPVTTYTLLYTTQLFCSISVELYNVTKRGLSL